MKMVGLGRLGRLRPTEQRIRSSMFQYASGAGFKGLAKQPLSLAAKRRVCLAGAGRHKRTGWGEESARNGWVGQLPRSTTSWPVTPIRPNGRVTDKRNAGGHNQRRQADLRGVIRPDFLEGRIWTAKVDHMPHRDRPAFLAELLSVTTQTEIRPGVGYRQDRVGIAVLS